MIKARAGECGSPAYYLGEEFRFDFHAEDFPGQRVNFSGPWDTFDNILINLPGQFQAHNAAVALMGLSVLRHKGLISIDDDALRRGMTGTEWPARLEKLSNIPLIILDCAHNPAAMQASVESIIELFPDRRIVPVVGMLKDKDVASSLRQIRRLSAGIVVSQPDYERALPGEELARIAATLFDEVSRKQTISAAIEKALETAGPQDMILITGSLFNVAEVKAFMEKTNDQTARWLGEEESGKI